MRYPIGIHKLYLIEVLPNGPTQRQITFEWNNELGDIGRGINQLAENVDSLMTRRVEDEKQQAGARIPDAAKRDEPALYL